MRGRTRRSSSSRPTAARRSRPGSRARLPAPSASSGANLLYRWDALARTGYAWWIDRFRAVLALADRVRLDHFRGFEAYREVPGDAPTAVSGRWAKGPAPTSSTRSCAPSTGSSR
ncbi:MAG: 4-alpha-glucanotransferase [Vicinamibacteria bacterium]